jgi:hypothetical protein
MIHPNVITYEQRSTDLKSRKSIPVTKLPVDAYTAQTDCGIIDQIRSQPKPNEISKYSTSFFKSDIDQVVKLMGAFCKKNSIKETFSTIKNIHGTLNAKDTPEIKNWIRLLTGLHPELDKQIKNLGYWKMPYSEVMGTNTILYYAGPEAVDILYWAGEPKFTTNKVEWFTTPWEAPSYIRESTRQKLDSAAVEMIQNANHVTTKYLRRNLIWESRLTTEPKTGAEIPQERPIMPKVPAINHGASLNNDWYHQTYRIMDGEKMDKHVGRHDAICHLTGGGFYVHQLVNHLTPLVNVNKSQSVAARFEAPLGIEETFPRRPSGMVADIDNSGQKVYKLQTTVNNDILKPEIITGE